MIKNLSYVTITVPNQDKALELYTSVLDFEVKEDSPDEFGGRFLCIAPKGRNLNLPWQNSDKVGHIPWWIFEVDNCQKSYEKLKTRRVKFVSEPQT